MSGHRYMVAGICIWEGDGIEEVLYYLILLRAMRQVR